jgi:hypothetical protein
MKTIMDKNHAALLQVADRCQERGRRAEAERWRECAAMYADHCAHSVELSDRIVFALVVIFIVVALVSGAAQL